MHIYSLKLPWQPNPLSLSILSLYRHKSALLLYETAQTTQNRLENISSCQFKTLTNLNTGKVTNISLRKHLAAMKCYENNAFRILRQFLHTLIYSLLKKIHNTNWRCIIIKLFIDGMIYVFFLNLNLLIIIKHFSFISIRVII